MYQWDQTKITIHSEKVCLSQSAVPVTVPEEGQNILVTGMLIVSLSSVNCRFWSHLGCLGWKFTIFAHSAIAYGCAKRIYRKKCHHTDHTYLMNTFYVNILRTTKNTLALVCSSSGLLLSGATHILVSLRGLILIFRRASPTLLCGSVLPWGYSS